MTVQSAADGLADRAYWLWVLERIAGPVLRAAAERRLKSDMPIEAKSGVKDRHMYTHLEAVGRTLAGIAPWLSCRDLPTEEEAMRRQYAKWARQAITSITDPQSPDFLNFSTGGQPLVDTAFLAHGILRAPKELLDPLPESTRSHLARCLQETRRNRKPGFSNWLLFCAMTEALLQRMGEDWDAMRVDYALRQHEGWYVGDGVYGDGPRFHFDYYNSFVIQPMLVDVLDALGDHYPEWERMRPAAVERIRRYAEIQERLIGPDGSYPPLGRSITYRFGAFQALSQAALMHQLPEPIRPAQVRSALTAVIRKFFEYEGMFDERGWLTIGLYGHQPGLGEPYISTGSLYLCLVGLLPLGLPPSDEFWSQPGADWTQRTLQLGYDLQADHALNDR